MPKYRVVDHVTVLRVYEIEAVDEEDAEDRFLDDGKLIEEFGDGNNEHCYIEIHEVKEDGQS